MRESRLLRQESGAGGSNSPFLNRRKSPRSGLAVPEHGEALARSVREALQGPLAALDVDRTLAGLPLQLESARAPDWDVWRHCVDQDEFFGDAPAVRGILLSLAVLLEDRASFEVVAHRFREWGLGERLWNALDPRWPLAIVLRAVSDTAIQMVSNSLAQALTASSAVLTLRQSGSVKVNVQSPETIEVVHVRSDAIGDCEVQWSATLLLDRRVPSANPSPVVKKGILRKTDFVETSSIGRMGPLQIQMLTFASLGCEGGDKKKAMSVMKTMTETVDAMNAQ